MQNGSDDVVELQPGPVTSILPRASMLVQTRVALTHAVNLT